MSRYPQNVELPRWSLYRGSLERNSDGKWCEYEIARDLVNRLEVGNNEKDAEIARLRKALEEITREGVTTTNGTYLGCECDSVEIARLALEEK